MGLSAATKEAGPRKKETKEGGAWGGCGENMKKERLKEKGKENIDLGLSRDCFTEH